mmetsp:Transcript_8863/g.20732  ORF Transcript_8863/g.20732 Transcript_8863/m.20732 type:complete len:215 (-) Transcript_8863:1436-2080(-)
MLVSTLVNAFAFNFMPLLSKMPLTSSLSSLPSPLVSMAWNIVSNASSLNSDSFFSIDAPLPFFFFTASSGTTFSGRGARAPVSTFLAARRKLGPLMLPPTPAASASLTKQKMNSSKSCDKSVIPSVFMAGPIGSSSATALARPKNDFTSFSNAVEGTPGPVPRPPIRTRTLSARPAAAAKCRGIRLPGPSVCRSMLHSVSSSFNGPTPAAAAAT